MSASHVSSVGPAPRHIFLASSLLIMLFAVLFYSGFSYSGLIALMAEWQYSRFGEWYPMLSVLSFCALAVLLWRGIGWLNRRRRIATKRWTLDDQKQYSVRLPRAAFLMLYSLSAFCFAMVMGAFVYWLTLPQMNAATARLNKMNVAQAKEGAVTIGDLQPIGPIVRFRESILDIGPSQFFAPVAARRTADGRDSEFALFAELAQTESGPRIAKGVPGILRHNALPGDLIALYRANGYAVSATPKVIFLSAASSSRTTLVLMVEALLAGTLFFVFGWWMRRRYRKTLDELGIA
jgi:hypothetical protein